MASRKNVRKVKKIHYPWKKILVTGILSGLFLMLLNYLVSLIPLTQNWYSETFPYSIMSFDPTSILISSFISGFLIGGVYSVVHTSLKGTAAVKGLKFGFLIWLIIGVAWLVTTIDLTPMVIWVLDFVVGLFTYLILGLVIGSVYDRA